MSRLSCSIFYVFLGDGGTFMQKVTLEKAHKINALRLDHPVNI